MAIAITIFIAVLNCLLSGFCGTKATDTPDAEHDTKRGLWLFAGIFAFNAVCSLTCYALTL